MTCSCGWLPGLVFLESSHGNWEVYLNKIYRFFKTDFVDSSPTFPGKRVGLIRHPMTDGKEFTFWHFIQEGSREEERTPDLRRCERIRWPRPIIEAIQSERVHVWRNRRKTNKRIVIALEDFSYVVVLEDRTRYVLPWTAYTVEQKHRREKLEKEYLAFKRTDVVF